MAQTPSSVYADLSDGGKFVILNWSVPSLGNYYFCLFQSRPTRRSKLSQRFEGAASLPSLETPTPTSALLLCWYSLLWPSATPNQVWASALPCHCMGHIYSFRAWASSSLRSKPTVSSVTCKRRGSASPLSLDLKSCASVSKNTEMNAKISVCGNCGWF